VTFAKLQELMTGRPVTFPGGPYVFGGGMLAALALAGVMFAAGGENVGALAAVLMLLALALGVLFVLPVGGADVPIVISLLNAFTGLAVAASGYILGNALLLIGGTLVGAAGTLLTQLMAAAMGRPLSNILFGAFTAKAVGAVTAGDERPVRSVSADDVAILLGYARKVVIVPGYGLAVAQAQHTIRDLADTLEARGVEVLYGIHPVAGRMPGHMNVLLAEAEVPYDQVLEMDEINSDFGTTDIAFVLGANDVVNPLAETPGSPIYGMPILDVHKARTVLVNKRSMASGYAGIDNPLFYMDKTMMVFGDAKKVVEDIVKAIE
ncbi:MAG: NAD(P)(+) transhydrogenase (Re/Si-specific) subunit beta, partial [Dongiaceae bacterium]